MAEELVSAPAVVAVDEAQSARPRISWGAVFAGAFSAIGLWLLLYALGLALGLSTVDPNNPGSVRGLGIFTGAWSAIAPLLALFIGGLVAGRLAGVFARGYGALHGLVMWGLVSVAGAYLVMAVASLAVAGVASVGKTVVQAGGAAVKNVAGAGVGAAREFGIDWDDALGPINRRLAAEGKPTVSAGELQAAARDAAQGAVRSGRFDRAAFEESLAQNTALSRADVQALSQRIQAQVEDTMSELKARARGVAETARTDALKAAEKTGKAFWGVFAALLLGLVAAIVGGMLGVPRLLPQARTVRGPRVTPVEPPPRGPILPPREAYPRG
jgi:hypothetical protein